MKEIPERKALSTTSVKPRDPAANWWRVTAQRTFTAGSPCRSPHGKAVDLKFSRDSSTPASAPLTASRLPPKPALRSRHVSDSVAASAFPNLADDSGDDDTKWKQYADSHFSRSVPMPSFFMGDDEFTPPDFPYDQDELMSEKSIQSDTDSNSISQTVQKDSEGSFAPSSSGTSTWISRIQTPQWTKTDDYTVVQRLDRHETVPAAPSHGGFQVPIPPHHHAYPAQLVPSTSPQKPHPPQRSVRARPPSTPQTLFSPSVPSTSSSSLDSETYPTVVSRRTPVYPRLRKLQVTSQERIKKVARICRYLWPSHEPHGQPCTFLEKNSTSRQRTPISNWLIASYTSLPPQNLDCTHSLGGKLRAHPDPHFIGRLRLPASEMDMATVLHIRGHFKGFRKHPNMQFQDSSQLSAD
uniref:Leucine-rich repeat and calponin homology domain-containing protein 3 n=1 Tax=Schistocephalus solidus TaxID=70667 RepID=A0A0X3PQS9_SCHSO